MILFAVLVGLLIGLVLGFKLQRPALADREHDVRHKLRRAKAMLDEADAKVRTAQAVREQADEYRAEQQFILDAIRAHEAARREQDPAMPAIGGTPIFDEIALPLPTFPDFSFAFDGVPSWQLPTGEFETAVAALVDGELVTR